MNYILDAHYYLKWIFTNIQQSIFNNSWENQISTNWWTYGRTDISNYRKASLSKFFFFFSVQIKIPFMINHSNRSFITYCKSNRGFFRLLKHIFICLKFLLWFFVCFLFVIGGIAVIFVFMCMLLSHYYHYQIMRFVVLLKYACNDKHLQLWSFINIY